MNIIKDIYNFLSSICLWVASFLGLAKANDSKVLRSKSVLVEYDEVGVAKVILNRPKKKNAITEQMYGEIEDALRRISADRSVRVCLLVGSGDFYCAGNDLSNFSKLMHPLTMAKQARGILESFVDSFICFGKPLIVAVNGPAIGIAVTTLGLCDRVYASDTAYFKTPFAELGQAPEGCSSYMFPLIMGEKLANEVLWKGKVLSAQEASASGLVYSVHSKDDVVDVATEYCRYLATLPPGSPETFRAVFQRETGLQQRLKDVNRTECAILERKWVSKECFLALALFLESRNMKLAAAFLRYSSHFQVFVCCIMDLSLSG